MLSSGLSRSSPSLSSALSIDGGTRYLTVQDIIELHRAVSSEFGGHQAFPGVIDSQFGLLNAVQRPQSTILGREAYPNFSDKASVLFFALIQNRPFRAGNRRVALAALIAFCEINNRTMDSRIFDEKAAETMVKRAASYQEMGIAPEDVFRNIRELLSRAISTASS
jgi:death-on-curing protein